MLRVGDVHLALVARKDADPRTRAWGDHLAFTVPATSRDDIVRRLGARGWHSQHVHGRVYVRNADASLTLELLVGELLRAGRAGGPTVRLRVGDANIPPRASTSGLVHGGCARSLSSRPDSGGRGAASEGVEKPFTARRLNGS